MGTRVQKVHTLPKPETHHMPSPQSDKMNKNGKMNGQYRIRTGDLSQGASSGMRSENHTPRPIALIRCEWVWTLTYSRAGVRFCLLCLSSPEPETMGEVGIPIRPEEEGEEGLHMVQSD